MNNAWLVAEHTIAEATYGVVALSDSMERGMGDLVTDLRLNFSYIQCSHWVS